MNKAIFLDRDGVINEDKGYIGKIEDFVFVKDIFDVLKKLQEKYKLFIITNQSGIAQRRYTTEDYIKLTEYMLEEFGKREIKIEKVYYCPHSPIDNCECRKPKPGMIFQAQKEHRIDLSSSWVIGDKFSDIETGRNAGCKTILIDSPYVKNIEVKKFKNLYEVSQYILETDTKTKATSQIKN